MRISRWSETVVATASPSFSSRLEKSTFSGAARSRAVKERPKSWLPAGTWTSAPDRRAASPGRAAPSTQPKRSRCTGMSSLEASSRRGSTTATPRRVQNQRRPSASRAIEGVAVEEHSTLGSPSPAPKDCQTTPAEPPVAAAASFAMSVRKTPRFVAAQSEPLSSRSPVIARVGSPVRAPTSVHPSGERSQRDPFGVPTHTRAAASTWRLTASNPATAAGPGTCTKRPPSRRKRPPWPPAQRVPVAASSPKHEMSGSGTEAGRTRGGFAGSSQTSISLGVLAHVRPCESSNSAETVRGRGSTVVHRPPSLT